MIRFSDPMEALLKMAPSRVVRGLTYKQRAAIAGSVRFRAWMAGRRAGKSYAAAVWLLGGGKSQISAYCSRTLKSSKSIMLGVFSELNHKFSLGLEIRASTGTITEPSGHIIQFYGLRDVSQADLIRGNKFRRVFIDEGGAFTDDLLKYSIESVIQPALVDQRGDLIVAGTPGPVPKGYFYEMTGNPGLQDPVKGRWPTWHWTFRDNPNVPREDVLAEALEVNGWTETSATFLREYGGIWCEDTEALIYKYKGEEWATPPDTGYTVMALDFGVVDHTAWSIWRQGYDTRPHIFGLECFSGSEISLPTIAKITREFQQKWAVNKIIADEGALGKALADNLRSSYRLPIEAAKKRDKRGRIDGIVGRLAAGTLHLCEGMKPLREEWKTLCWNETRTDHHERQLDDISDTVCYVDQEFSAWEYPEPPKKEVTEQEALRNRANMRALKGNNLGRL